MAEFRKIGIAGLTFACLILAGAGISLTAQADETLPAFPGAEGFGAVSKGGRGGKVLHVTNLNSKGPGSLQWACDQKGPRIVVFDVSGVIVAPGKSPDQAIRVKWPNITIAGQTAPGAGITIQGKFTVCAPQLWDFPKGPERDKWSDIVKNQKKPMRKIKEVRPHDVIIRFIRTRPEDYFVFITGGRSFEICQCDRAMVDHVSTAWGVDEQVLFYYTSDFTFQYSTVEESDLSYEKSGQHNYGMLVGYTSKGDGSIHHNLFAHHSERAPLCGLDIMDFRNNVIYNVGSAVISHPPKRNRRRPGKRFRINMVGNYFKAGPGGPTGVRTAHPPPNRTRPGNAGTWEKLHAEGNYMDWAGGYVDLWEDGKPYSYKGKAKWGRSVEPWPCPPVTTHTAEEAYAHVLAHVGCLPRDAVSRRNIEETRNRTGIYGREDPAEGLMQGLKPGKAPKDTDQDGMPDEWETARGLDSNAPEDANKIVPAGASDGDRHKGYTYIEYYINELADKLIDAAVAEEKARKDAAPVMTVPDDGRDAELAKVASGHKIKPLARGAIAAGSGHTLANHKGGIWSWGFGWQGQLGNDSGGDRRAPVKVKGAGGTEQLTGMKMLAAGGMLSLAVQNDGTLLAWGSNADGQLGTGGGRAGKKPAPVKGPGGKDIMTGVVHAAAGCYHALCARTDGTVWSWGRNDDDQLGDGSGRKQKTPVQVTGPDGKGHLTDVIAVAAGAKHSIALKKDGSVWAWGDNIQGQCGDGTVMDRKHPVRVLRLKDIIAIDACRYHNLALRQDGTVWGWGHNLTGQLGTGKRSAKEARPVPVSGPDGKGFLDGVVAVACGGLHSAAIREDGSAWAWGYNGFCQLGTGRTKARVEYSSRPIKVHGLKDEGFLTGVKDIAGGGVFTTAILTDGTVVTWGNSSRYQAGDGAGNPAWFKDNVYTEEGGWKSGHVPSINRAFPVHAKLRKE